MVEGWIYQKSDGRRVTHHAIAALASLGCRVRTHRLFVTNGRTEQRSFFVAPSDCGFVHFAKGSRMIGQHLLKLWKDGRLPAIDPLHPFLDAMRALENLRLIREAVAGRIGSLCLGVEVVPGKVCPRTRYNEGAEVPSLTTTARAIVHEDCRVAALGVLGVPLQHIQRNRFMVGAGIALAGGAPLLPCDPASVLSQYNAGALAENHPFVVGLRACHAFDALCRHLEPEKGNLLVRRRPNIGEHNPRRAFLEVNAPGAVFDRVQRFIESGH